MSKEIYISSTPHETRLAIVENDALAEIYYERENEYTLAGSIYNGRVTRVLPGMQSSFVDVGLERDAFLYITDFMEDAVDTAEFDTGDAKGGGRRDRPATGEQGGAVAVRENGRGEAGRNEGRDRNARGNRDKNRGSREARPQQAHPSDNQEANHGTNEEARVAAHDSVEVEPLDSDVSEGAPGADGNRRWRGRRGRRRGREDGAETPQVQETQDVEAQPREVLPELSAAAEEQPRREDRGPRGDRNERGGRNDRGGRPDRSGGGRDRFAASGGRGGAESQFAHSDTQPTPEPFILPGESLSRYRRGADGLPELAAAQVTPVNVTVVTAKPSTLVEPALNWDGGLVLPGETLSRHRGGESRGGNESRGQDSRGRDSRGGNRDRGGREERPARPEFREKRPAELEQLAVISQHAPQPLEPSPPWVVPVSGELFGTPHEAAPAEYEPAEEASASFRVDPAPPSEFRQSAFVEPEAAEAELAKPMSENPAMGRPAYSEAAHSGVSSEVHPEPVFAAREDDAYVEAPVASVAEHEFTTVQPSGEMLSAPVEPAAEHHSAEHIAAPIAHETAVQSVTLSEAEVEAELTPVSREAASEFAPGVGELEEEVLDEEEGDILTLHAHGEHDDMEEETLEGAADLGSMIREMSIDQMTKPSEATDLDEEDDFDTDEEDLDEEELDHDEFEGGEEDEELSGSEVTEGEADEFAEADSFVENGGGEGSEPRGEGQNATGLERNAGREERPRRDGRDGRSSRRGERGQDRDRVKRDGRGMANSRSGSSSSHSGGGRSRQSMQSTNLPDISDLLKPGQELLVQIAKEPIAKKGARITSHIALPGRFLVFMPTVNHVGVSRKIESDGERRRLKEILLSEKGDAAGGFIVRTAGASASEDELRSDLRFLLNLWADIKQRSESSKSPALIYHDLNLIERILRDQVTDNFSAIWVDSESEYERVLRFLQRFQPSLIRRVKLYTKETPLFEQFGITEEINKALRSKVWLKSGGSIVINQTEALVAIDINTGKFVGKTARLEDTIVKTNLDAIPEIVRQIRLRDLGGIIIIDFIDMDERKNRNKVMAALEEELKSDRAPSKVLQFNDFGLVAITRKRVKQSLERTLSTTCGVCQGTGMVKSPVTVCNDIYIELKKMQKHLDRGDVMLRVNPEVVKQLKAPGTKWLQEMEEMIGKTILVKSDPSIHPEQFDIH
ncbi:MAG: Rne/Rng family ribonuclease [Acidobacteriota bacterium]|nr:Rne/Rng family ribonuclease [Acidobacteriota bacterium]